jgi:transmembrane sensor
MNDRIDLLIIQYLDGQLDEEDRVDLENWISESRENREYFQDMVEINDHVNQIDFDVDTHTDSEWEILKERLPGREIHAKDYGVRRIPQYWKLAAAIALLISIGWFIFELALGPGHPGVQVDYAAALGNEETFKLDDGSAIILNAGSKLIVAGDFGDKDRYVSLEGEAFFKVAPNPDVPFTVRTGEVETTVLGTSFLLRAYPEENTVELSVSEGRVHFHIGERTGVEIEAGSASVFNSNNSSFDEMDYNENKTVALLSGKIVFIQDPLRNVFRTLERKYNVSITDQSSLQDRTFTSSFDRSEDIESILKVIGLTFNLEIVEENGEFIVSHSLK